MGSTVFMTRASGLTAKEAFESARDNALYEEGHGGYTGTIAEKSRFVMIPLPEGKAAENYANDLIDAADPRIDDKWGPAGCIEIKNGQYLFFGWASC